MAYSANLFVCISIVIVSLYVTVNCDNSTSSSTEYPTNVTSITGSNAKLSTRSAYTRKKDFRKLYIWSLVILITILVVLFIWYAYEMTQDCIKDEEEEQDRSLYLPLYPEEEEERDINLSDNVYNSNVPSNVQNTRPELSKTEDHKNWPDLKVTNGPSKSTIQ